MGAVTFVLVPAGLAKETRLRRAAVQAIATGVLTAVVWDTVDVDELGAWAAGAPTRLTIPATGIYHAGVWAGPWTAAAIQIPDRRALLYRNGTDYLLGTDSDTNASDATPQHSSVFTGRLLAADFLELMVFQGSTTTPLNLNAASAWLVGPL